MEDFNSYAKRGKKDENGKNFGGTGANGGGNENLFSTAAKIAKQFDGKSQQDLLRAIYEEAKKGKRAGTLSNKEIDGFVAAISPALDDKKRKYLYKIAEELKKI